MEGKLYAETSYDQIWIAYVKVCIPVSKRSWDTQAGIWTFDPAYYRCVLYITQIVFGNDIIDATGGVSEPQEMDWKPKLDSHVYGRAQEAINAWPAGKPETPRAILFVTEDAPDYVVTAAYRALAARNHPDKGGNETAMKRINAAYEVLKRG